MIEFRHVSKSYDDGALAVSDLSLTVSSHEITVLHHARGLDRRRLLSCVLTRLGMFKH
jgi:hypothetical protein